MAATLEERVSVLERDMTRLKARVDSTDPRVEAVEADLAGIPELVKMEARLVESRDARVRSEINERFKQIDERFDRFEEHIDARVDAVIRAIAELVVEKPRKY